VNHGGDARRRDNQAAPALAHDCFNPNTKGGAGVNPSLTGGVEGIEVHVVGINPHGVAGGPGSQTAEHGCDGQGIDYLEACLGE
jgi:hypothetical protein